MNLSKLAVFFEPILSTIIVILILYSPYLRFLKSSDNKPYILKRSKFVKLKTYMYILLLIIILYFLKINFIKLGLPFKFIILYCVTSPLYPQIISNNAIIGPKFYIEWSNIENVTINNESLILFLKKPIFLNKKYYIECDKNSQLIFYEMLQKKTNIFIKEET